MKYEKPVHPLKVYTGLKTYTIPKSLLTIDPNQCIEDYKGTLLHEICHIGFDLYGLGDDEEMPQIGNEYLTTVTANMILQLSGLNKELFEFIFEQKKAEDPK